MDKYEYNLKVEQIEKLYLKKDFKTIVEIADNFDIRKIKDNNQINIISESYEEMEQYEDAREVLLLAYERSPLGRQLAFRLTILSLKAGLLEDAVDFYDDFVKMAPKDIGQYILRYEIAKAKQASLDEQIAILEEYISLEMDEKWQYELAKLYHQAGYSLKCVELCDEVILWFSEGNYVKKAMELKMLYVPLTEMQQDKYDRIGKHEEMTPPQVEEEMDIEESEEDHENEMLELEENQEDSTEFEMDIECIANCDLNDQYSSDFEEMEEFTDNNNVFDEVALTQEESNLFKDLLIEEKVSGQIELFIEEPKEVEEQIEGQLTIGELLDAYDEKQNRIQEEQMLLLQKIREEEKNKELMKQEYEKNIELEARLQEERIKKENDLAEEITKISQDEINMTAKEDENILQEETNKGLTEEYKAIFERFLSINGVEEQLVSSLNNLVDNYDKDGTSKKNNLIIMGEDKSGRSSLVIDLIKIVNKNRGRKGRKIAKVRGAVLNNKDMKETITKLFGADLIIEQAANMNSTTIEELIAALKGYTQDMIVILEDNQSAIERLLSVNSELQELFGNVISIQGFGVKDWVEIAKEYALDKEYTIDDMGILALHVKIGILYSQNSEIMQEDVYQIMDHAISKHKRAKIGKFISVFSRKNRETDLTILKETDFM